MYRPPLGVALNASARLEARTKEAACPILIDEATRTEPGGRFAVKALEVEVFSVQVPVTA